MQHEASSVPYSKQGEKGTESLREVILIATRAENLDFISKHIHNQTNRRKDAEPRRWFVLDSSLKYFKLIETKTIVVQLSRAVSKEIPIQMTDTLFALLCRSALAHSIFACISQFR